jgi:2'-phosphotransferase
MNSYLISKTMSTILRHTADKEGINIDKEGYININDLINNRHMKKFNLNQNDIYKIVETNNKQRFSLNNDKTKIRANQGHSKHFKDIIDEESIFNIITNPILCIHGTTYDAFSKIEKEGLKSMSRTHIHCAIGYPKDNNVISGARNNSEIFIEIDMEKAMKDGIKFYLSSNNVILIKDNIQPKYFKKITRV